MAVDRFVRSAGLVVLAGLVSIAARPARASAAVALYNNNFDTQVAGNNTGTMTATTFTQATPGPISFTPQSATDFALSTSDTDAVNGRGSFGFRFGGTGPVEPLLTFSFTVDGPVSGTMQMRIDNQTNNAVGSSTQFIIGTNLTTPLATTSATSSKTLLYFINQGTAEEQYLNPVDGSVMTLEAGTFDHYIRDNTTTPGTYTQLGQNGAFVDRNGTTAGFGELNKFALGNTGNGEVNSFTIDDVLLENDISEAFAVVPEPSALALLGAGGLLALRRRAA